MFKTPWMNKKSDRLISLCEEENIFGKSDIIESIQTVEQWALKYEGAFSFRKDYVGPKGFLTNMIPKLWWNRGAWIHDGWFKNIEINGEFGFINLSNANKFFNICNKVNTPKESKFKWINKIAYLAVSVFSRFVIKKRK